MCLWECVNVCFMITFIIQDYCKCVAQLTEEHINQSYHPGLILAPLGRLIWLVNEEELLSL